MNPKLFGTRIRQAREQLGLSQEDLATLVARDQRAISEYENGKRRLSATDVPAFAKALDVPILYFYEGEARLHDFDRAVLEEFHRLPTPEAMQTAIQIVRLLSETLGLHSR